MFIVRGVCLGITVICDRLNATGGAGAGIQGAASTMNISLKYDLKNVNWAEITEIFRLAPLGKRGPEKLRRACENSYLVCLAYDEKKLIGMGRALSDGEYQAAIYDLVVRPEYQDKGIGRQIMEAIQKRLPVKTIILYAVPGKEPFYQKLGYFKMRTAMARRNESIKEFRLEGYIE
jgi:ribosomal protein S18 acetylase RimI-like enzyme